MPPSDDQQTREARPVTAPPSPQATPAAPPPPADPANQQRAVAALFVALLSLAGLLGLNDYGRGIYVALFALLAGVVALWLGVGAVVRARRGHTRRPAGSVTAVVIAGAGIAISGLLVMAFSIFGAQLASYGQCLSGANTISAQQSCQRQFTRAVTRKLTAVSSGTRP